MNEQPQEDLANVARAGQYIAHVINRVSEPQAAKAYLASAIALAVSHISDEEWKLILEASKEPCVQPECFHCHVYTQPLYEALDTFRTTLRKVLSERGNVKIPEPL